MKSLYVAVTIALAVTLCASLVVFLAISQRIQNRSLNPVFEAMDEVELQHAREQLASGGPKAVETDMLRLNQLFGVSHYLLDSRGVDVVNGEDRKALLPTPPLHKSRGYLNCRLVITHQSADGKFWFVALDPRQPNRWTFFPYYVLVLTVAGLLCWLAAVYVIRPIRKITSTLDRFGKGEFSVRVHLSRRDEIGGLARSFDSMAGRIETLLTSERRLLEDISHELRSPLARLKFAVRLAKTAPQSNAAFARVDREVNRITSLVSEIVELTRTEADPSVRKRQVIHLSGFLDEVVSDCRFEAESRNCDLQLHGEIEAELIGDAELLRRAVENVIRNAIRYSPESAPIEVSVELAPDMAVLIVKDHGPGVPEEALQRIFDPFFRVEIARAAERGGVGLGLSIARRAILLHKGTISARNAVPGLEVRIALPLRSS